MELFDSESQSVYYVEFSKVFRTSWLLVPANNVGSLGHIRDWSLPQSSVVQANLKGIHAVIRPVCAILQKLSEVFLSL